MSALCSRHHAAELRRRMTIPWSVLLAALLLGAIALLGGCASKDNLEVKQIDCNAAGLQVGVPCGGGIVYDLNHQGAGIVLTVHPADFPSAQYRTTNAASPPPAQNLDDGRANSGTFAPDHPAAWLCQGLVDFGHDDWYLPAANELSAMYDPGNAGMVPGLVLGEYWSSSEYSVTPTNALTVDFSGGPVPFANGKNYNVPGVRCIRRAKAAFF